MAADIEKQLSLADYMSEGLVKRGWKLPVQSNLGVVVFTHEKIEKLSPDELASFHKRIIDQGNTWFSILKLKENLYFRACVTSFHTEKQHVEQLFVNLDDALHQLPH